jgi:hypothetical protein
MSTLLRSTPSLNQRSNQTSVVVVVGLECTFDIRARVLQLKGSALTGFANLNIISAHLPFTHLPVFGESPVFETITPLPLHSIMRVLELVPELYRDLVICKGKQLFSQTIVLFFLPLLCEKVFDRCRAGNEGRPVPPNAIGRVGLGDDFGVPIKVSGRRGGRARFLLKIPEVLCLLHLRMGRLGGKWRNKRHVFSLQGSCDIAEQKENMSEHSRYCVFIRVMRAIFMRAVSCLLILRSIYVPASFVAFLRCVEITGAPNT